MDWLHRRNPDGHVVGFVAFDESRLAAHYGRTAAHAHVRGHRVEVLLSLNIATRPDDRDRGLFTRLAGKPDAAGAAKPDPYGLESEPHAVESPDRTVPIRAAALPARPGAGAAGVSRRRLAQRAQEGPRYHERMGRWTTPHRAADTLRDEGLWHRVMKGDGR